MIPSSRAALGVGLALAPMAASAVAAPGVWQVHEDQVLGAPGKFVVTTESESHALAAISAALAEIDRLDSVFNSRRADSELGRLNRSERMVVSPELFDVLSLAEQMREASGGAYNGGLGALLALWRGAGESGPDRARLQRAAIAAQAQIGLDPYNRCVTRPKGVSFALDGIAKGYIVDRALAAGLASGPVAGMAVDIGGDIRCAGRAPNGRTWDIDIGDPAQAPGLGLPVATAHLREGAVATSGRGPRDFTVGDKIYSATVSPADGWAAQQNMAATVTALTTAEADALATALLVMPADEGLKLAGDWPGVQARITTAGGQVCTTVGWRTVVSEPPVRLFRAQTAATSNAWLGGWAVDVVFRAPDRTLKRDPAFRSPYVAIWISDKANKPLRTLLLVGQYRDWQKDNFIWWSVNKEKAEQLLELRSVATAQSGTYGSSWLGYDETFKFLPLGEYVLHVETSRERGRHTYRTLPFNLGRQGFTMNLPATEEGGGITLTYGKKS